MSREKSQDTRTRILDAAWRRLESDDPRKSRMGDIAKEAGISRQALYLHFPSRTELLVATARHLDEVHKVDLRLEASRAASNGTERLDAFVAAWGNYVPKVFGVARAFIAMMPTDDAAAAAWKDRQRAVRQGCKAAVLALSRDGRLDPEWDTKCATDWLWAHLSVENWERLVRECDWDQEHYIETIQRIARQVLVAE